MEIDSNYIQYLVSQEVAKAVEKAMKPIQESQVKIIERSYDLQGKLKEIAPEFVQRKWALEEKGVPTSEALDQLWDCFDKASAEIAVENK